jgi:methylmalonyl-CoA mutase cobalamin-binding subunit
LKLLEEVKIKDDVKVILGGFLPEDDEIDYFKKLGVKAVFDVDSHLGDIVGYIRTIATGVEKEEGQPDADLHKNI